MVEGWLRRLKSGLEKSSQKITGEFHQLFLSKKVDQTLLTELEEVLIQADLGVAVALRLKEKLAKTKLDKEVSVEEVKEVLAEEIAKILYPVATPIEINSKTSPHVILVCGVNGSGKTTTIGKLASQFVKKGLSTALVAGDTFRAAAVEQLQIWGERSGSKVIHKHHGSDAAGLVYDAIKNSITEKTEVLIIDTAGRLQNRLDLMAELEKVVRVIKKIDDTAPHDVILVMDSTIGQNAHNQVKVFKETIDVSGLVVTKLDGSAKGGVVVSLAETFGINVHAVGVGEGIEDLRQFDPKDFARSLVGLK